MIWWWMRERLLVVHLLLHENSGCISYVRRNCIYEFSATSWMTTYTVCAFVPHTSIIRYGCLLYMKEPQKYVSNENDQRIWPSKRLTMYSQCKWPIWHLFCELQSNHMAWNWVQKRHIHQYWLTDVFVPWYIASLPSYKQHFEKQENYDKWTVELVKMKEVYGKL